MSDPRTSMDPGQEKAKKARLPRGYDRETVDMFEGKPRGEPPKPRRYSKAALTLLEHVLAMEGPPTDAQLAGSPPEGMSAGSVRGALRELVRAGTLDPHFPEEALSGMGALRYQPNEGARLWLRNQRDLDAKKKEPRKEPRRDEDTLDVFTPSPVQAPQVPQEVETHPIPTPGTPRGEIDPERPFSQSDQSWALGRIRWLALHDAEFRWEDYVEEVTRRFSRPLRGEWEERLLRWSLTQACARGWVRKMPGATHYRSRILAQDQAPPERAVPHAARRRE